MIRAPDKISTLLKVVRSRSEVSDGSADDPQGSSSRPISAPDDKSELDAAVTELLSFSGAEHLLRAAPLNALMAGGGNIFSTSRGTPETYALSHLTNSIGFFMSHNWTVPRVAKFLSLTFRFNMMDTFVVTVVCLVVCLFSGMLGLQPAIKTHEYDYHVCIGCRLLIVPAMLLTLLFSRFFRRYDSGPTVFLDKVCIHQADPELMREGIRKLGAFLRVSDRMLVLYSSVYLKRLWTVYEVASFLVLHSMEKLELVPIMLPCTFFGILVGHFIYQLSNLGVRICGLPEETMLLTNFCGAALYLMGTRLWAKSRAEIHKTLLNFSVAEAKCAVESDREVVYANIVALMKASRRVRRKADAKDALEAFELEVRGNLANQFNKILGRFAFSYTEYVLLALTVYTPYYVDSWSVVWHGAPFREVLAQRCLDLFWIFTATTFWHLALEVAASHCVHLTGWKNFAYIMVANAAVSGVGTLLSVGSAVLTELAEEDDLVLITLLLTQVITTALSIYIFSKWLPARRQQRPPVLSTQPSLSLYSSSPAAYQLTAQAVNQSSTLSTQAATPLGSSGDCELNLVVIDAEDKHSGRSSLTATTAVGSTSCWMSSKHPQYDSFIKDFEWGDCDTDGPSSNNNSRDSSLLACSPVSLHCGPGGCSDSIPSGSRRSTEVSRGQNDLGSSSLLPFLTRKLDEGTGQAQAHGTGQAQAHGTGQAQAKALAQAGMSDRKSSRSRIISFRSVSKDTNEDKRRTEEKKRKTEVQEKKTNPDTTPKAEATLDYMLENHLAVGLSV